MTLNELARYLHLGQKTVLKLAREKKIPAVQLDKEWRFRREDIETWLEKQLHGEEGADLAEVTDGMRVPLGDLLPDKALVHDMRSTDALGAIEELAARAYSNNWLNDKPWFIGALVEREALASTAMEGGVAFLHTRARDTSKISRPFLIVGRSYEGIEFGSPDGEPTYLFFLLGLKYDKLHLPILGRLARIMLRDPRTTSRLRATTSPTKMRDILLQLDANERTQSKPPPTTAAKTAVSPVLDKDLRLRAIMRAQARRKHEIKKAEEEARKAKEKADKEAAAEKRRAETAERRRIAAEKRAEASRIKKEKAAAARKREQEKKRLAREKKKAAAAKKKEAARKKREREAAKRKKAAERKKAAAAKKREAAKKKREREAAKKKKAKEAAKAKREREAKKKKAAAAKKKAAAAKKKAAAAKKKAAAAKKKKKKR